MTELDKDRLSAALDKIRGAEDLASAHLDAEEVTLLRVFAETRLKAGGLPERVEAFCTRIMSILAAQPMPPLSVEERERVEGIVRKNQSLRAALNKVFRGSLESVTEDDVELIHGTLERLDRKGEFTGRHQRLRGLLEKALRDYEVFAETQELEDFEDEAVEPVRAEPLDCEAGTFCAAGRRELLRELEGIPLGGGVRVCDHEGDLTLRGDVPDNALIRVRNGGLTVHGFMSGHAVAAENIHIHGNVGGGVLISESGTICVRRILTASRLIAVRGDLIAEAAEMPEVLFAGGAIRISGSVRGGRLLAGSVEVGGAVASSRIEAFGPITARSFECEAPGRTVLCFRNLLTPRDFGRALDDRVITLLRTLVRTRIRVNVGEVLTGRALEESRNIARASLYYLAGETPCGPTVQELRDAQSKRMFMGALIAASESLQRTVCEAWELGEAFGVAMVTTAVDECLHTTQKFLGELSAMKEELARSCKRQLAMWCRHLSYTAKKLNEATVNKLGVEPHLTSLDQRVAEWRGVLGRLGPELAAFEESVNACIGPEAAGETEPVLLAKLVQEAVQAAQDGPDRLVKGSVMRMLESSGVRHAGNREAWHRDFEQARENGQALLKKLAHRGPLLFWNGQSECRYVRGRSFSRGVRVTAWPPDAEGGDGLGTRTLDIASPIEEEQIFTVEADGIKQRRPDGF